MNTNKQIFKTLAIATLIFCVRTSYSQDTTKAKPEFKPSGKVWGYAFGDYFMKMHADSLNRGKTQYANMPNNSNAFEFRRVYLGYNYDISEKFSSEFLLSYEGQTLSDNATRTVFIKAANIRWKKILPNTDLIFGQSATPAFATTTEKIWAYRSVEKTIMDMRGIVSSNDLGLALQSKLISNDKTEVGLHLMVGNGTAQKLEFDRFKKIYGGVYALVMNKKILIDLYGDYNRDQNDPYHKSKITMKAAFAYTSDMITAGVELYNQTQEHYAIKADSATGKKDTANVMSFGASVFVKGRIIKDKLGYFARYDMYNPDNTFGADKYYFSGGLPNTESFITAGLDYTPVKNVHIMPNIWYNSYSSRVKNSSGLTKNDYDMVARLTFYYLFK
ncbi:MAG: hypothetical protein HY840_15680 [Bacteroidetes bacterium]|nr:hypothetical protein [Bacteroidota bacterium]